MLKTLSYAAVAASLFLAGPALAQAPAHTGATPPSTTAADPAAAPSAPATTSAPSTGTKSDTAATASAGSVTAGMSVKDNTGALIGEVTGVKEGVATIKMGTDTFAVDTTKLAVQDGAATINATQADIRGMLKKK